MQLSATTLMRAILAVRRDLRRHERVISEESLADDDGAAYGKSVVQLSQALNELEAAYAEVRTEDDGLPTLEQLERRAQSKAALEAEAETEEVIEDDG